MRERFHVTYETVTPESAARSDFEEAGFIDQDGRRVDLGGLCGPAASKVKADCALTLRQALDAFGTRFSLLEADVDSYSWPEFVTSSFATGEQERMSLHLPATLTDASRARLERLLRCDKLI